MEACVLGKLLPIGTSIELAHVVGMTMCPVMAVKGFAVKSCDGENIAECRGVLGLAQDHSVIKNNSADRHAVSSLSIMRYMTMRFSTRTAWETTETELARASQERKRSGLPLFDLTA